MTSSSAVIRPALLLALFVGILLSAASAVENESSPTRQLQAPDVEISLYSVQEEEEEEASSTTTKSSIGGGGRREDRGGKGKNAREGDDDDDGGKKGGKKGRGGDDDGDDDTPTAAPSARSVLDPEEVCLVTGFELDGRPFGPNTPEEDQEVGDAIGLLQAACPAPGGILDALALELAFEDLEESGFGSYPLFFFPFRDPASAEVGIETGMDIQVGALNGEAWCASLGSTTDRFEKGIVQSYNIDMFGTQDLEAFRYDYFVRECPGAANDCGNQFYLNIYLSQPEFPNFSACRLDFVPATSDGAEGQFDTFSLDLDTPATVVGDRDDDTFDCTGITTLQDAYNAGLVIGTGAGSCYSWALNVGDTSLSDSGLDGCYDNIQVTIDGAVNTYDFQSNA